MVDIQSCPIHEDDLIVFIQNERGQKPRLVYGIVRTEGTKSISAELVNGEFCRLSYSKRSHADERLNNVVVIKSRQVSNGSVLDCTEYPIIEGDKVAFMEVPSQGFCTSLIIGVVLSALPDAITIKVNSAVEQKYLRKPDQVVVVESASNKIT